VAAVRRLPGVEEATVAEAAPFSGWSMGIDMKLPGADSSVDFKDGPYRHGVGEGYFRTTGTRILRGRGFEASDFTAAAEPVIVINQGAAQRIWPREEAVGKCVKIEDKSSACARIIGVAQDTHRQQLLETDQSAQVYTPIGHSSQLDTRAIMLMVRAHDDPAAIVEPVRRTMQTLYSGLPFANVFPMETTLDNELRPWRLGSILFGIFGAIALVLSALGLYSVVGYSVAQRTHEMGVRVALGAQVRDIIRLVLVQGVGVAALGIVLGLLLTLAGAGLVSSLLYETSARNPMVLMAVSLVLLLVAIAASLVPALRATRADPLSALRAE